MENANLAAQIGISNRPPGDLGTSSNDDKPETSTRFAVANGNAVRFAEESSEYRSDRESLRQDGFRRDSFPEGVYGNVHEAAMSSLHFPSKSDLCTPTMVALQEWEGYVVDIGANEIVARLIDLTAGRTHESAEATIPLEEISERDVSNMQLGSFFRWVIGYEVSPEGTRKRLSQIVFRDLPRITEADIEEGKKWGRRISARFNS